MSEIGIFVSSTSIVTLDHMNKLRSIAFVGNTCHFDVETKFVGSLSMRKWRNCTVLARSSCGAEITRQVCAGSASDKIHDVCSSNGCAGSVSD